MSVYTLILCYLPAGSLCRLAGGKLPFEDPADTQDQEGGPVDGQRLLLLVIAADGIHRSSLFTTRIMSRANTQHTPVVQLYVRLTAGSRVPVVLPPRSALSRA